MRYLVIHKHDVAGWGAYAPELPGRIAVGQTREEVEELFAAAVRMHLDDGLTAPGPAAEIGYLEVALRVFAAFRARPA